MEMQDSVKHILCNQLHITYFKKTVMQMFYMFRLVVNKKYVSDKLLKAYNTKPVMVMPEDPLFLPDE